MYKKISIVSFLIFASITLYSQLETIKDTIVLTQVSILKIDSKRMHYFPKDKDIYCSTVILKTKDSTQIKILYRGQFSIPTNEGNLLYLAGDTCYLKEGNLYDIVLYKTCIENTGESVYRYLSTSDSEECSAINIQKRKKSRKKISLDYKHSFFELDRHLYKMNILMCGNARM